MYTYAWYHWITLFFLYSFFGWILESAWVSILKRHFVNRGFLRLPMLPIYGTGAVMLLWLTQPVQDSFVLLFLVGAVGATVLEYVTGWVMERLFKMKYWDYSDQPFNFHGYICLSSTIAWGFLTILLTRVIHPPIAKFVLGLNPRIEIPVIAVVGAAFAADAVMSVKEALDLGKALEAMTKMKAELDDLQVQAALLRSEIEDRLKVMDVSGGRAETAGRLSGMREDAAARVSEAASRAADALENAAVKVSDAATRAAEKVSDLRAGTPERQAATRNETADFLRERRQSEKVLSDRIRELKEKRQALKSHMNFYRRGILRGNPSAASARFSEALTELRELVDGKTPDGKQSDS